jgi:hypothetical protein
MTPKEPFVNRSRRYSAFTLIELLVVIGLIALLSTLLLIGMSKLQTNSRRQATRLAFQNAQAMFSEWDVANRLHFASGNPVPCPGLVTDDAPDLRALIMTRGFMFQFQSMPSTATALGKLSASAFTRMSFNVSIVPTVWNPTTPLPQWVPTPTWPAPLSGSSYNMLDLAQYVTSPSLTLKNYITTTFFMAVQPNTPTGTPVTPPLNDQTFWIPVGSAEPAVPVSPFEKVPMLLDGWGNPIIFVPSGVLGTGAALSPGPTPPLGYPIPGSGAIVSSPGSSGASIQVSSPDGRPFWASAGPDGIFRLGDDNMYSFEK